jgi:hypothetical protein
MTGHISIQEIREQGWEGLEFVDMQSMGEDNLRAIADLCEEPAIDENCVACQATIILVGREHTPMPAELTENPPSDSPDLASQIQPAQGEPTEPAGHPRILELLDAARTEATIMLGSKSVGGKDISDDEIVLLLVGAKSYLDAMSALGVKPADQGTVDKLRALVERVYA